MNTENTLLRTQKECTWQEIQEGCKQMALKIGADIATERIFRPSAIVTFPRGGLVPAAIIAHTLGDLWGITTVMTDSEFMTYYLDAKGTMDPGCFLLVDDISDTGQTLKAFMEAFRERNKTAVEFIVATVHKRPDTQVVPDYFAYDAGQDWIIYPWE